MARVAGVADGERAALGLVAVQQSGAALALDHRGKLPAEIDGVLDGGVVAKPAGGREQMHGIAAEQDAAALEVLGHQRMTSGPGIARQDLDIDRCTDGGGEHRLGVGLGDAGLVLVRAKLGVEGELAAPVDRRHQRATLAVEGHIHPGRRMLHDVVEILRAQIDRQHAAADEVAHHAGLAAIADAERLAHQAARSVGADQVGGADIDRGAAVGGLDARIDMRAAIGEFDKPPAVIDRDAGQALGMLAQHRLDEFLRDTMRQLGRAPRAAQRRDALLGFARGRQLEPRQLIAGVAGEISDVGGEIRGHAKRADFVGETQAAVMLHGPRLGGVGLRVEGRCRLLVDQHGGDAAPAELIGQHQAARAAADNQDRGFVGNHA